MARSMHEIQPPWKRRLFIVALAIPLGVPIIAVYALWKAASAAYGELRQEYRETILTIRKAWIGKGAFEP